MPESTSEWAAEGTLFHDLIPRLLRHPYLEPSDYLGRKRMIDGHLVECDVEMVKHIENGLDWVLEQPGERFVETIVSLGRWIPGCTGTSDLFFLMRDQALVADWKYGAGEPVDAEDNEQLLGYGLGVLDLLEEWGFLIDDAFKFVLMIRQPRAGGVSTWTITARQLRRWAKTLVAAYEAAQAPDAPRTPSEKACRWCKAVDTCKEHRDYAAELLGAEFDDEAGTVAVKPPKAVSLVQRGKILLAWPLIERWHKALKADAMDDALAGRPTPGQWLIEGKQGDREWINEDWAVEALLEVLPPKKITKVTVISPTEAEKLLEKREYAELEGLIGRAPGRPALVADTKKGTPYKTTEQDFEDLAQSEDDYAN